jgi:tagatose-6-phosphate ketose/aldose isomerase
MNEQDWHRHLSGRQKEWQALLAPSPEQREAAGYGHTAREICQQPATWQETANVVSWSGSMFAESLAGRSAVLLTGSGSSQYVADCLGPALQAELGIPVGAIGSGAILANPDQALPASDSALMVSFARSGDSPESYAAIDLALSVRPRMRHLVITCNRDGRLATEFRLDDRVRVMTLDDRTNDRSLVMTSSATNMIAAGRFLGMVESAEAYRSTVAALEQTAGHLLDTHTDAIAGIARSGFERAVFLGTGTLHGAAREASLKLLEMTEGRIPTLAETYLGLRHGPMSFVHEDTLVVCFLSYSKPARNYEMDLIRELNTKRLGSARLIVGEAIPASIGRANDTCVECPGLAGIGDGFAPVVHIVVGQLLALFRCLAEGLRPDAPSTQGVIARVVPGFQIHKERS